MRKGIFATLSVGAALAAAIGFAPVAHADLDGNETMLDPAVTLIMPFDVTANHASFELVSRIGGAAIDPVATHWSFWSESCDHLADVFICLTQKDTIVVDPTALQGQLQSSGKNVNTGPVINLSGAKGFVTVTAYDFLHGASSCTVNDPSAASTDPSIVGSWVVANTSSNAAFGNNAYGLQDALTLPDATVLNDGTPSDPQGLFLQTFDPTSLQDSEVFFIGVAAPSGNGEFAASEVGPIPSALTNGHALACDAEYCDNVETCVSIPDLVLDCSSSRKIADNSALGNDATAIIPASIPADTSGFVHLTNCVIGDDGGVNVSIGDGATIGGVDITAFLFAFHGQSVGPFGTAVSAKYTSQG